MAVDGRPRQQRTDWHALVFVQMVGALVPGTTVEGIPSSVDSFGKRPSRTGSSSLEFPVDFSAWSPKPSSSPNAASALTPWLPIGTRSGSFCASRRSAPARHPANWAQKQRHLEPRPPRNRLRRAGMQPVPSRVAATGGDALLSSRFYNSYLPRSYHLYSQCKTWPDNHRS